ncbi:MAG: hypothetical protein E6J74_33090 [Deltaproteobacteria bacterium]|nr:MAG: hypothetical protein E6J74_33090 [Deltaproteobacteria bacterium]
MAEKKKSLEATLMQRKIFNKVCMAYRRSCEAPTFAIRADELRKELSIPKDIFAEALYAFIHTENQMAVEVFQREGQTYREIFATIGAPCRETVRRQSPNSLSKFLIHSSVLHDPAKALVPVSYSPPMTR